MLSSLAILRSRILPAAQAEITKWDSVLELIGNAVQAQIESHLGRTLAHAEDAEETFPGERLTLKAARYPILEVASLTRTDYAGTTTAEDDNIEGTYKLAGLITLYTPGIPGDTLTLTYTGGYYIDDTDDLSGTPPTGVLSLPADIREAWFLQVAATWQAKNQNGTPDPAAPAGPISLLPAVLALLAPHRRLA